MKRIFLSAFTLLAMGSGLGQNIYDLDSIYQAKAVDSLKKALAEAKHDSNRVKILKALAGGDTVKLHLALELAEKIRHERLQSELNRAIGVYNVSPARSLAFFLKALDISESIHETVESARNYRNIGRLYNGLKDYTKSRDYLFKSKELFKEANSNDSCITLFELGEMFHSIGRDDSALVFYQHAYKSRGKNEEVYAIRSLAGIGNIYAEQGNYRTAMDCMLQALEHLKTISRPIAIYSSPDLYLSMAKIFKKTGQNDSSLFYAQQAFNNAENAESRAGMANAGKFLFEYYDGQNDKEAFKYLKIFTNIGDSLNPVEKAQRVQDVALQEDKRRQSIEAARIESANRTRLYFVLGGLLLLLIIAIILFRNNRQKQKANELLNKQKHEIEEQRSKAERALNDLRTTQSQLIQSEKMASLGELTAGIAHEIQNPLNFVNNFAEVSAELAGEMEEALKQDDKQEAITIAAGIMDNLQKITHHGKRADAIVKGMLQHSRASTGKKELTDINTLADEYLRLSYHGLRAKDKSFNADFKTNFDEHIEKIEVIPQDIGRVLLNLYNNAFYSVNEKKKNEDNTYKPLVSVSTRKVNHNIEVEIKDNGSGIPPKILDKIYQPFFTTKPTGQGTGLGLSLSYDIIKAHGGQLQVETKEGQFAKFTILLPVA